MRDVSKGMTRWAWSRKQSHSHIVNAWERQREGCTFCSFFFLKMTHHAKKSPKIWHFAYFIFYWMPWYMPSRRHMKYKIARTWATFLFFQGILQMDMWGVTPSDRWDWDALREMISKSGVRNSLLIAPMPTASTSQILGNNECFEPYTSNIYSRRVLRFVLLYQADFCKVWLFFPLPSNHIHFQRWICCDEQTPPSWFNGDGSLVTCS